MESPSKNILTKQGTERTYHMLSKKKEINFILISYVCIEHLRHQEQHLVTIRGENWADKRPDRMKNFSNFESCKYIFYS